MIPRFKKPAPCEMVLTERDEVLIWAAYRRRFVTYDDIQRLTGGWNRKAMQRRINMLWGNDYIDRPEIQEQIFARKSKRDFFVALGNRGAELLATEHGAYFPRKVNWEKVNADLKDSPFIQHTLGVSRCMTRAECDTRDNAPPGIRLVERHDIWRNSPNHDPRIKYPYSIPTVIKDKKGHLVKRNTKPDEAFAIHDSRGERTLRGLNFLEYDRIVEDYMRSSLHQSSIYQKYLGYADIYNRGLHKIFGYKKFRVPFVIESRTDKSADDRIASMIDLYHAQKIPVPAGLFIYTTTEKFFEQGFLAPVWVDVNGKSVSLVI